VETDRRSTVTRLLGEATEGRAGALSELMPVVYEELRALAESCFRAERGAHTLQPTALVHEAFVRLAGGGEIRAESRGQFFALASKAMRNVLVDHARARDRQKRGGGWDRVSLTLASDGGTTEREIDVLALNEALEKLGALDERKARLVELRFFGGLGEREAAETMGIARSTASDEWRMARAWLGRELREER
jgi:RNA polymerase sigma factor (TIGR02999 family)